MLAGPAACVVLALIGFALPYSMEEGQEYRPGVLDEIEPGSPAWVHGLRSGSLLLRVENRTPAAGQPCLSFDRDLIPEVMTAHAGQQLTFVTAVPGEEEKTYRIEPRFTVNDHKPVIGVAPIIGLALIPAEAARVRSSPVFGGSAAARATPPFDFGDAIVACTDPDGLAVTELPAAAFDPTGNSRDPFVFARRLHRLAGKDIVLRVRRAGETLDIKVPDEHGSGGRGATRWASGPRGHRARRHHPQRFCDRPPGPAHHLGSAASRRRTFARPGTPASRARDVGRANRETPAGPRSGVA